MANKIYEAGTLLSAMDARAEQYHELKDQLNNVKKAFNSVVNLDENFQGQGAEAIKGFFQAQIDVVDAWISLIDRNIAFFNGIPGLASDAELSGDTVVQVPFLEEELDNAWRTSDQMVTAQQDDLQKIFDGINDLVPLSVFSRETFDEHMDEADKKRNDTIEKVNTLDANLKSEYESSESEESYLVGLFSKLLESSSKGGTISPLYFDAQKYKSSEVYKLKDEAEKQTKGYLSFKRDQAEARRIEKEMKEMENRPWYEKTWDAVSTFTGEITGYYDYKRATEGIDPVTGEKLSTAQRVTAGAMAAAGFIPIVGWAGRAFKGGSAIYKTARGMNAASHALDAYKTSKSFNILQQTEMGIYGLVATNGLSEAVTGKDMFGNELTVEQRQSSLLQALGIAGVAGAARYVDYNVSKGVKQPYSNQYAQKVTEQGKQTISTLGKKIGQIQVPVKIRVQSVSTGTGIKVNVYGIEKKSVSEMMQQQFSVNTNLGKDKDINANGLTLNSKSEGKTNYTYNMIENPGPLTEINPGAASTFRSGMYNVKILESETILYRSGKAGGGKNALGQYFTREPGTRIQGRLDSAVKAQWIDPKTGVLTGLSPLDTVYAIKIPKGTTIYEGPAGNQGGSYVGGGNQIFVSEPWRIKGVEVISQNPIR
ncbi:transposase [Peribacillus cavernae]|uniref:Transposase n=1 Tax=Peribacillus cavernae TaxID=1674310 RepID=A0A3S0U4Z5_9BACI|nr:T7SS effector LXG polymorphic toxin [Peribacillus cavernae]MDQ0217381.1 putative ribonuclease toxin of YeeF-YezG toxin-antitoxin module [Peribacillus cavernae]RUQ30170.1 transposase [Peribacillus cavernae]